MEVKRWWPLILLVASYVLLVSVVVAGAFWIQHEFNDANYERCIILQIQVDLIKAQSQVLTAQDIQQAPISPELEAFLDGIKVEADKVCPLPG